MNRAPSHRARDRILITSNMRMRRRYRTQAPCHAVNPQPLAFIAPSSPARYWQRPTDPIVESRAAMFSLLHSVISMAGPQYDATHCVPVSGSAGAFENGKNSLALTRRTGIHLSALIASVLFRCRRSGQPQQRRAANLARHSQGTLTFGQQNR